MTQLLMMYINYRIDNKYTLVLHIEILKEELECIFKVILNIKVISYALIILWIKSY
jgi:hypothetical protein